MRARDGKNSTQQLLIEKLYLLELTSHVIALPAESTRIHVSLSIEDARSSSIDVHDAEPQFSWSQKRASSMLRLARICVLDQLIM